MYNFSLLAYSQLVHVDSVYSANGIQRRILVFCGRVVVFVWIPNTPTDDMQALVFQLPDAYRADDPVTHVLQLFHASEDHGGQRLAEVLAPLLIVR